MPRVERDATPNGSTGTAMDLTHLQSRAEEASALLRAMGNEHRLMMLFHMAHQERSVGELLELTGLQQSAVSQHLLRLRQDGLVRVRRDRQTLYYSLAGQPVRKILDRLCGIYGSPRGVLPDAGAQPSA